MDPRQRESLVNRLLARHPQASRDDLDRAVQAWYARVSHRVRVKPIILARLVERAMRGADRPEPAPEAG